MIKRLAKGALSHLLRLARCVKFQILSTKTWTGHVPRQYQRLLLAGLGAMSFLTNVRKGMISSPKFWSSECYIDAQSTSAKVKTWQNTSIIKNGNSIS